MYLEPRNEGYPLYRQIYPCAAGGISGLLPSQTSTRTCNNVSDWFKKVDEIISTNRFAHLVSPTSACYNGIDWFKNGCLKKIGGIVSANRFAQIL